MTDPARGAQRYRVLIADDSEAMRRVLTILLSPDTFALREVTDGEEALTALKAEPFDLLLTDLHMPNRDGLALVRALREMEATGGRRTCVIVISGHGGSAAGALEAGADRVLPKPVQPSALLGAIVELLVDPAG
jgi:CheY-like chemotaxis protein